MGISVNRIINFVAKTNGATVRTSLGGKELNQLATDMSKKEKLIFDKTLAQLKDPHLDIAYKASEKGYTIGAVTIRDGKNVIGNGALSVTGLGTEQSVVKYRLNIGENGKAVQSSGFLDNTKKLSLDDIDINLSKKKGIITASERLGEAIGQTTKININELTSLGDKVLGMPAASIGYETLMGKINRNIAESQQMLRNFIAGKDVRTGISTTNVRISRPNKESYGSKEEEIREEFRRLFEDLSLFKLPL